MKGQYYFYIGNIQIPIPPEQLNIAFSNKNETVDLLSAGEVNIPKDMGLTSYAYRLLLPNSNYPFNQSLLFKSKKASYYIDEIMKMKKAKQPVNFIVIRMKPDGTMLSMVNTKVTIEDLNTEEAWQHGFDVYLDIVLKEWKSYGTKKLTTTENADGTKTQKTEQTRETSKTPNKNVEAPSGGIKSTLQRVIKKELGNTNNLFAIAALNKITVPCYLAGKQALQLYENGKGVK